MLNLRFTDQKRLLTDVDSSRKSRNGILCFIFQRAVRSFQLGCVTRICNDVMIAIHTKVQVYGAVRARKMLSRQ